MQLTLAVTQLLLASTAVAMPWNFHTTESVTEIEIEGTPLQILEGEDTGLELRQVYASADYATEATNRHNIHRANHTGTGGLVWNANLASSAAAVAASCKFAHNLSPGGGGYGQNLAAFGSSDGNLRNQPASIFVARAVSNQWYNGEFNSFLPSYYGQANPGQNTFSKWGHFSQLVWKGTGSVGCASQFCAPGTIFGMASWFTVCNYKNPGNVGGAYGTNIGRPLGKPTVSAP